MVISISGNLYFTKTLASQLWLPSFHQICSDSFSFQNEKVNPGIAFLMNSIRRSGNMWNFIFLSLEKTK